MSKKTNTVITFKPAAIIPEDGPIKNIASGRAEVFKLDPRLIERPEGFNPRFDFGDMKSFKEDLLANDVIDALKVRKEGNRVFLVNGDRRLTAVEALIAEGRWPEDPSNPGFPRPIPCTSEGRGVSPTDRLFMMLSLNTGKPFNMLEKATAYQQILDETPGMADAEIARRSGETKQAVSNALTLVRKAAPKLIALIKKGKLSATTALEIAKTHEDHTAQMEAATTAIESAANSGRDHATPKDLPGKEKKEPVLKKLEAEWKMDHQPSDWDDELKRATDGSNLIATGTKWGITRLEIRFAYHHGHKLWYAGLHLVARDGKDRDYSLHQPIAAIRDGFPTAGAAILSEWPALAERIKDYAADHNDAKLILLYLDVLGSRLQAVDFPVNPIDPPASASTDDNSIILDPDDDEDEDEDADDLGTAEKPNPNKPADPGAIERIKNASSGGSGGGGGGGSTGLSTAKFEQRLGNVDDMFDELEKDECHPDRWDAMELLIDYINGAHTVATLKKFLKKSEA